MFASLSARAKQVLADAFPGVDVEPAWTLARENDHGDVSLSTALQLAKKVGKNPKEIAGLVAKGLEGEADVLKVEVAGNGYVNVWLKPEAFFQELDVSTKESEAKPIRKDEAPVIVEYSSPNIAKPLGIHHILSTSIGQAIANLYVHTGYNVIHWNYIADWGLQFGKVSLAYKKWGTKSLEEHSLDDLLALYVKFHEEAEQDSSLEDQARAQFKKMEDGDTEIRQFLKTVTDLTKKANKLIYDRLQVAFDIEYGEGFYEDKMAPVIDEGKEKGVMKVGEKGALIVEFPEETKLPPYMIVKGDGATLYSTRDLAQMRYRIDTYHPQGIYIVVDIAQKLHFDLLVATCKLLGWELPDFEHVIFGRMSFADKGMSTRKGNIVKLSDVLDEAVERARKKIEEHRASIQTDDEDALAEMMGIGALIYGILSQNRKMDIVFDWDKMLSFEGNSAPYLQYAHARARSVLRKAQEHSNVKMQNSHLSLSDHERTLIKTLLHFPYAIREVRETHMPHKLANYLYQLAQDFNAFYNVEPILKAEGDARALRLHLTQLTADALRTGAALLSIRVPDRM